MSIVRKLWGWGKSDKFYDDDQRPKLWPYLKKYNVTQNNQTLFVAEQDIKVPVAKINNDFFTSISQLLKEEQIKSDDESRLRHTFNQSYLDLFCLRQGIIERAPDLILYPESQKDVEIIVEQAHQCNICLIPYGGGTNVAAGTDPEVAEQRMIVVVDLGRMDKIIALDERSRIARVQAGIIGQDLEEQLNRLGYTCGHDPDSIEFSTLGGWIASRSSGMLSNKYGDIVDLLVSATLVTPIGTIAKTIVPATSAGPDFNHLIAGSEGNFGIITEATIHIFKLQKKTIFKSFLVPSFELGAGIVEQFVEHNCLPALVRVLDAEETGLSASTVKKSAYFRSLLGKIIKTYITKIKHFNMSQACFMFLKFVGDKQEVAYQWQKVKTICDKAGAFALGSGPAQAWDEGKYDLALLRDLVVKNGVITDACETATIWSNVIPLYNKTKEAMTAAIKKYTDMAWVGCHISHTYRHGACLYFLFACAEKKGAEIEQYLAVKNAATATFATAGGTISHHHSVGRLHQPYLATEISAKGIYLLQKIKNIFDPKQIMNPGKLIPLEKNSRN